MDSSDWRGVAKCWVLLFSLKPSSGANQKKKEKDVSTENV